MSGRSAGRQDSLALARGFRCRSQEKPLFRPAISWSRKVCHGSCRSVTNRGTTIMTFNIDQDKKLFIPCYLPFAMCCWLRKDRLRRSLVSDAMKFRSDWGLIKTEEPPSALPCGRQASSDLKECRCMKQMGACERRPGARKAPIIANIITIKLELTQYVVSSKRILCRGLYSSERN